MKREKTNRLSWTTNYTVKMIKEMSVEINGSIRYTPDISEDITLMDPFSSPEE